MPTFTVTALLPASPQRIYDAWLDPRVHARMTGGRAAVDGDTFSAWDGYIRGVYVQREPGRRIAMSWRTGDFADNEPSAHVVVDLAAEGAGTLVTLTQSGTPTSQGDRYVSGWQDHYFTPMQAYFSKKKS